MSEMKSEDNSPPAITPELKEDFYYNCYECSSLIEITSIDEEKNFIEFNCLNKKKITIKILPFLLRIFRKNILEVKIKA